MTNQSQISISASEYKEQLGKWTNKSRRDADLPRRLKARFAALRHFQIAFDSQEEYSEPQVDAAIQQGNIFDLDHV